MCNPEAKRGIFEGKIFLLPRLPVLESSNPGCPHFCPGNLTSLNVIPPFHLGHSSKSGASTQHGGRRRGGAIRLGARYWAWGVGGGLCQGGSLGGGVWARCRAPAPRRALGAASPAPALRITLEIAGAERGEVGPHGQAGGAWVNGLRSRDQPASGALGNPVGAAASRFGRNPRPRGGLGPVPGIQAPCLRIRLRPPLWAPILAEKDLPDPRVQ